MVVFLCNTVWICPGDGFKEHRTCSPNCDVSWNALKLVEKHTSRMQHMKKKLNFNMSCEVA